MSQQAVHARDLQKLLVMIWRKPDMLPRVEVVMRLVAAHDMTATEGMEELYGLLAA